MSWSSRLPIRPAPVTGAAVLRLWTPLVIRRGQSQIGTLTTLPLNLWNRLRSAARWLDAAPEEPTAAVRAAAAKVLLTGENLMSVEMRRYSRTTGPNPSLHNGWLGRIGLEGEVASLWPLLCFGAFFHAGGSTALGFGRYELIGR